MVQVRNYENCCISQNMKALSINRPILIHNYEFAEESLLVISSYSNFSSQIDLNQPDRPRILSNHRIRSQKQHTSENRLGHLHPIERVFVNWW